MCKSPHCLATVNCKNQANEQLKKKNSNFNSLKAIHYSVFITYMVLLEQEHPLPVVKS